MRIIKIGDTIGPPMLTAVAILHGLCFTMTESMEIIPNQEVSARLKKAVVNVQAALDHLAEAYSDLREDI